MHLLAEHLIPAADSEHPTAAPDMAGNIQIPPLGAQVGQVADGRFRPGDQDQSGIAGQGATRLDDINGDIWLQSQRVQIIEIRDTGKARHSNFNRPGGFPDRTFQSNGIFRRKLPRFREIRHHAKRLPAGTLIHDA